VSEACQACDFSSTNNLLYVLLCTRVLISRREVVERGLPVLLGQKARPNAPLAEQLQALSPPDFLALLAAVHAATRACLTHRRRYVRSTSCLLVLESGSLCCCPICVVCPVQDTMQPIRLP